jgi:hypothetical protein
MSSLAPYAHMRPLSSFTDPPSDFCSVGDVTDTAIMDTTYFGQAPDLFYQSSRQSMHWSEAFAIDD